LYQLLHITEVDMVERILEILNKTPSIFLVKFPKPINVDGTEVKVIREYLNGGIFVFYPGKTMHFLWDKESKTWNTI